jgi:hypothetical protein
VRHEVENSLAESYRRLTLIGAAVMLVGWLWHLWRHDAQNALITLGIGLLLLTPLVALLHLAYLVRHTDRLVARYSVIAVVLVGLALVVGLLTGGVR